MYGIVVWTVTETATAMVWCSDNKELAYISGDLISAKGENSLTAGDLVWITCQNRGHGRYCTSFEVIRQGENADAARRFAAAANVNGMGMRQNAETEGTGG